ncbi:hypothetical protein GGS26DRAFT_80325 [Hypomontagnella submonticulosa]|nr:hypothetical protein GGS26DRAFT_80325 [Hypomontagnella submonticulosa]
MSGPLAPRPPAPPWPPAPPRRDLHVCRAPGCQLEVERRGQVASRFCRRHTCEHFWEPIPGEQRCQNEKHPVDSVCSQHIGCQVPGCTNGRMQELDPQVTTGGPQYRRQRYCSYHKCSLRDCPNLRGFITASNRYHQYCDEHQRHPDECDTGTIYRRTRRCCQPPDYRTQECCPLEENQVQDCSVYNTCARATCSRRKQRDQRANWVLICQCGWSGCTYPMAGPCYCSRREPPFWSFLYYTNLTT